MLPGAWGHGGRGTDAAQEALAREGAGVPCVAPAVSGGDGDVRGRASLGAGDSTSRPRGSVDCADVRQGVHEGLLVRQRTQTVNSVRGHLAEFGLVAPRGVANVDQLWEAFTECAESLPELVVSTTAMLFERVDELNAQIDEVDKQMRLLVRENKELRRLTTIPGVGEVNALAVRAFAPSMDSFARGRDFAAWIGLTPREISTGGRQRLGRITKMGQRDLRQLLVLGAMSVIRRAGRRKEITDPWLRRMLAEKPQKLVAVALANKMARIIWALMVKGEELLRTDGARRGRWTGTVWAGNQQHGASRHESTMVPTRCGQDGERSRGKPSVRRGLKNQLCAAEPWSSRKRYGSDLTKTIRARGRKGLHREAGHTTVPDPHAALRSKSCLPTRWASTYGASPHDCGNSVLSRNRQMTESHEHLFAIYVTRPAYGPQSRAWRSLFLFLFSHSSSPPRGARPIARRKHSETSPVPTPAHGLPLLSSIPLHVVGTAWSPMKPPPSPRF